jgi:hypothetical protein
MTKNFHYYLMNHHPTMTIHRYLQVVEMMNYLWVEVLKPVVVMQLRVEVVEVQCLLVVESMLPQNLRQNLPR